MHISTPKATTSHLKIAFAGFWTGFSPHDNELLNLFRYCCSGFPITLEPCEDNADLLLVSCFGDITQALKSNPGSTNILFLGENVRPHFSSIDYSMTFDINSYDGKNIYFPLWLLRLKPWALSNGGYNAVKVESLCQPTPVNIKNSTICYIGNNLTPMRNELIFALRRSGFQVDTYGAMTRPVSDKSNCLGKYKFSICVENSYYPGYVTEKLFDSFASSTIPIYWGGLPNGFLNPNSFIHLDSFQPLVNLNSEIARFADTRLLPPLIEKTLLSSFVSVRVEWIKGIISSILQL